LDGYKLKGSWVLVRTHGYGARGGSGAPGRSWLLIKHKDDWAGPVDIINFAPYSVKTPDADFADILAADDPAIWTSNRPAKGGDAGTMFAKIVERALEIQAANTKAAKDTKSKSATKTTKTTKAKTGKTKAR